MSAGWRELSQKVYFLVEQNLTTGKITSRAFFALAPALSELRRKGEYSGKGQGVERFVVLGEHAWGKTR
jgi:hypothetical protein